MARIGRQFILRIELRSEYVERRDDEYEDDDEGRHDRAYLLLFYSRRCCCDWIHDVCSITLLITSLNCG